MVNKHPTIYSILDSAPFGVFTLQEDFTVLYWNRRLVEWTGIAEQDILHQPITKFFPHLSSEKYHRRLKDIFYGGSPVVFSSQFHPHFIPCENAMGEKRIQQTTIVPVQIDANTSAALFYVQDVTDLHYRIQAYRKMRNKTLVEIDERKETEKFLQKRLSYEKLITDITTKFLYYKNEQLEDCIQQTLTQILDYTEVDGVFLYLLSEDEQKLHVKYGWSNNNSLSCLINQWINLNDIHPLQNKIQELEIINIHDLENDNKCCEELKQWLRKYSIEAALFVPMVWGGKTVGFLALHSLSTIASWTQDNQTVLHIIGGVIASTLEKKNRELQLKNTNYELNIRNRISEIFQTCSHNKMYSETLKLILEITDSPYGIFGYMDGNMLICPSMTYEVWDQCEMSDKSIFFDLDKLDNRLVRSVKEKRAIYKNDESNVPQGHIAIKRFMSVPITYQDNVIGVFVVGNRKSNYTDNDLGFLKNIANRISPVLHARLERDREENARVLAEKERANIEERLRQSQKMEAIGQLAGGVAHDFNNLLTGIMGNLILAKMKGTEANKKYVEDAHHAAQRAADLVQKLLSFSRNSEVELVDLDVVRSMQVFKPQLQDLCGEDIQFTLQIKDTIPTISADSNQLLTVLCNMVRNANDAIEEKRKSSQNKQCTYSIAMEISTMFVEEGNVGNPKSNPGEYVVISIRDDGIGMSADVQKHIFEPFFSTKEVGKGNGLGLSAAFGVIKQHNGWIQVSSTQGAGSVFRVYLPSQQSTVASVKHENLIENDVATKGHILLADDENAIRNFAKAILEKAGLEVTCAKDGVECIEIYKEQQDAFDLIILDYSMPKITGGEVLNYILDQDEKAKVIICSGYIPDLDENYSQFANVALVSKPFNPVDLIRMVKNMLQGNLPQLNKVR